MGSISLTPKAIESMRRIYTIYILYCVLKVNTSMYIYIYIGETPAAAPGYSFKFTVEIAWIWSKMAIYRK